MLHITNAEKYSETYCSINQTLTKNEFKHIVEDIIKDHPQVNADNFRKYLKVLIKKE